MSVSHEDLKAYLEAQDAHTVHAALGIRFVSFGKEVTVEVDVSERLYQHSGIVHGGIYVLLGESAASCASAFQVDISRAMVAGMEVNANHLRPVTGGTLRCTARPVFSGRTSLVYAFEVENLVNEQTELCCVGRVTIAVRERKEPLE